MTSPLPRIAIPEPTSTDEAYNQRSLPQYIHAVEAAGGTAVPISSASIEEPSRQACLDLARRYCCPAARRILIPRDMGRRRLRSAPRRTKLGRLRTIFFCTTLLTKENQSWEFATGCNRLTFGGRGSLIQDLPHPSAVTPSGDASAVVNHEPGREVQNAHPVLVAPGSRLFEVTAGVAEDAGGQRILSVNSSHHQAVGSPGERLKVAATSPVDGVIEALEGSEPRQFVVAVQWHPERTYESSAASRALFAAFLEGPPDARGRQTRDRQEEIEKAFLQAGIADLPKGLMSSSLPTSPCSSAGTPS